MAKKDNNIRTAFFLNLAFTVLEVKGGGISRSIAILVNSLHDFADSLSLGADWYFEKKSRKGRTDKYSYGYARFSLLGAMINVVTFLLGSIYIVYASVDRIMNPQNPDAYWMLGISFLGIALNGIGVWKLKSGKSMNKQVMMIHLLEDALGWVAVLVGSIVMLIFDVPILDPILAIVINLTVLVFAMHKLVQALKILLQKVPKNINLPELRQRILCLDKVKEVEHLHAWSLTEQQAVVTVHVLVSDIQSLSDSNAIKRQIHAILSDIDTGHINVDLRSSDDS